METAHALHDLRTTLGVTDPEVLSAIAAYTHGESDAAYAAQEKFGAGDIIDFAGAMGRCLDKWNVYDPDTFVKMRNQDSVDFETAIDELRRFMTEKVGLSPEEIHGASRQGCW